MRVRHKRNRDKWGEAISHRPSSKGYSAGMVFVIWDKAGRGWYSATRLIFCVPAVSVP